MPITVARRTVRWNVGPEELPCEIEVNVYPPVPPSWSEWDGGDPGYSAEAEIIDATVIEQGIRREPTDEEWALMNVDIDAIEERALDDERYDE